MAAPAAADALIAIDIGNTRTKLAIWDDDGLHDTLTVASGNEAGLTDALENLSQRIQHARHAAAVISSVNPAITRLASDLALAVANVEPFEIRADLPLPLEVRVQQPEQVGVDRICSAAAAYDHLKEMCAVASFGTAITIDCVSREGVFLGGTILPGFDLSFQVLHEQTAQLPLVSPADPISPFGQSTADAVNAGVLYGAAGAVREIVERFATELGNWPSLVLTGGGAPLITPLVDFADAVVPDLCLMGAALAYRRAVEQT